MEDLIEVQMILITNYGEFIGKKNIIKLDQYNTLVKMAKLFYSSGFELSCEDGSFMVFSPDVIAKSILKIKKKLVSNQNKEIEIEIDLE